MYLDNERRPTLTPQLAWRVAIVGGVALAAFAVIFFRLWYLQVLSSDKYVAEAQNNQLRELLHMRADRIEQRVNEQLEELPFSTATVKQDVSRDVMMYIAERREDFR